MDNETKVKATVETARLEQINDVFEQMKRGDIRGRIALDFGDTGLERIGPTRDASRASTPRPAVS